MDLFQNGVERVDMDTFYPTVDKMYAVFICNMYVFIILGTFSLFDCCVQYFLDFKEIHKRELVTSDHAIV